MPDRVVRVERVPLLTRLRLILFRRGMLTGRFVLLVVFLVCHPRRPRRQWAEYRADQRHIRWMCRVLAELAGEQEAGVGAGRRGAVRGGSIRRAEYNPRMIRPRWLGDTSLAPSGATRRGETTRSGVPDE